MFKLEGFVDDKHVVKVMHALNGLVLDFRMVPVINAVAKNGHIKPKTNGEPEELLLAYLKKKGLEEVVAKDMREFALSIGKSENSYNYILDRAVKAKVLKKYGKGTGTRYKVVQ